MLQAPLQKIDLHRLAADLALQVGNPAFLLAALAEMPAASGAALGFDRLVMLATGATRIEQVLWTPVVEPG